MTEEKKKRSAAPRESASGELSDKKEKPDKYLTLTKILNAINESHLGITAKTISEKTGLKLPTVYRTLDFLEAQKFVHMLKAGKEGKSYSRMPETYSPPIDLTLNEILAMMLIYSRMSDEKIPLLKDTYTAFLKLSDRVPPEMRAFIRNPSIFSNIVPGPLTVSKSESDASFVETLMTAHRRRLAVRIRYDSFMEGCVIDTVLRPYAMTFHRRAWYCVGYSSMHDMVRTFHSGRIHHISILEDNAFTIPYAWTLESQLGNAWSLIRGEKDYDITIRFKRMVAKNVADVNWHHTQEFTPQEDGSTVMNVTVSGLQEIHWWIFGYADQAEVVGPPELRKMIKERLVKMMEIYKDD